MNSVALAFWIVIIVALAYLMARGLWRLFPVLGFHVCYVVMGHVSSTVNKAATYAVIAQAWCWYMIARSAGDAIPPYAVEKRRKVVDKAIALLEE